VVPIGLACRCRLSFAGGFGQASTLTVFSACRGYRRAVWPLSSGWPGHSQVPLALSLLALP